MLTKSDHHSEAAEVRDPVPMDTIQPGPTACSPGPHAVLSAHGLSARSPNDFIVGLTTAFPRRMLTIVREQAERLRHPPVVFDELVRVLEQYAPAFGLLLRELEAGDREATAAAVSSLAAPDDSGIIARMLADEEEIDMLLEDYRLLEQRQRGEIENLDEVGIIYATACELVRTHPDVVVPTLQYAVYLARMDVGDQLPGGWEALDREMDCVREDAPWRLPEGPHDDR